MIQSKLRETAKLALDVAKPMSNLVGKDDDISNSPYALISKFFPHMAELMLEAAEYIAELEAAIVSVGNALTELETDICKISAEIEPRLTKEQGEEVKSKVNEFVASMMGLKTEVSQVGIGSHGDKA